MATRTPVLSRIFAAVKEVLNPAMPIRVQAIRFQQKQERVNLYVTVLSVRQLLSQCKVDYLQEDNPRGYQRPLTKSRLKQVSAFLEHEEGMLPTSILLCIRQPDRGEFDVEGGANGAGEWGTLTIPPSVTLWLVDGQHRLFGLEQAATKDGLEWVKDYLLPVTIVEGINSYEEMRYFYVINTRHKGVPTDVVDRHLLIMRELEGTAILDKEGERNYLRGRATKLCDLLRNTPDSPWFRKVRLAGHQRRASDLVRQHTMVASLEPALKEAFIKRLTDEEAGKILLNFWHGVRERWPKAFAEPKEYTIQKTVGVYALHMIFPDVVQVCRGINDFSSKAMCEILAETGVSSGFWHRQHGHALVKETGARYMRALGEYLRQRLPRPTVPRL